MSTGATGKESDGRGSDVPGTAGGAADPTVPAGSGPGAVVAGDLDTPHDTLHDTPDVPPLAPDRPVVDGTEKSSEEIRAEVDQLAADEQRRVDELRAEVGDTVGELAARFDVPARARAKRDETVAKVQARKDEAVATVSQQVDRARRVMADTASSVSGTPWAKPAAIAGAVVVLLLVLLRLRRR
jgi:ElaB/YqjD/DUF883 family membrane-anchored ribosome-binding protein